MENDKYIFTITDKDITGIDNPSTEVDKLRQGARGIVLREDGKIALFNKVNKNYYKLPGGGIEDNEDIETAFKREVLEETGCNVEITDNFGAIQEYKGRIKFKQISHVFVGKVINDTHKLSLTEHEIEDGATLSWVTPDEALNLISNSYNELMNDDNEETYQSKFIVLRDKKILEYYLSRK